MKNKTIKYVIGSIAALLLSGSIVCAAVSCSNNNSSSNSTTANNTKATTIKVSGFKNNNGNDYSANYNSSLTLTANNENIQNSKNITYKWYCNNQLIQNWNKSTYPVTVSSTSNQYYVESYLNGNLLAKSKPITINPVFNASEFSAAFYDGSNKIIQSSLKNLNNTSYNLSFKLLYNNTIFNIQPKDIIWYLNDNVISNNNNSTFIPNLVPGANKITAQFTNLPTIYGIQNNTLSQSITINDTQLQITGSDVSNNTVNIQPKGSVSFSLTSDSLDSFNDNNISISNLKYQWYENGEELTSDTNENETFSDITSNSTFYLKATYTSNDKTYVWTSNTITVNVLNEPTITCSNDENTSSLQLDKTILNQNNTYSFSIKNPGLISTTNATATFTLQNTKTNQTINLSNDQISINSSLNIDFNTLTDFVPGSYKLTATISIEGANASHDITTSSFMIYYNNIEILANTSPDVQQVNNSNTYNVNINSSVTLAPNTSSSNVYITSTNATSYQWQEKNNNTWTDIDDATSKEYTISNVTGTNQTYRLLETIGSYTLTSNTITISPTIESIINATISSNNKSSVDNTLNIYSSSNASQELTLNLPIKDVSDLNVIWYVNGKEVTSSSNTTFTHTYSVGKNTVSAEISFTYNNKTYSTTANSTNDSSTSSSNNVHNIINITSFTINYYALNITPTSSTLNYDVNANTDKISNNSTQSHIYSNASYQWYENGTAIGTVTSTFPSTLPDVIIQKQTTFTLHVTNTDDSSEQQIISNQVTISVNNSNITASISTPNGDNENNTLDIYSNVSGSSYNEYTFTLNVNQNNEVINNALNHATITWYLNNKEITSDTSNTYTLSLSSLNSSVSTYTLKASVTLPNLSSPVDTTYKINYHQLQVNATDSSIYYDHGTTLNLNETSFGNLISSPNYFWEYENDGSWQQVESNSNQTSTYTVNNLTQQTQYRVIVANSSTLDKATVQIISDPITLTPKSLSNLSFDLNINGDIASSSSATTVHTTNITFSLSNLEDIAGLINANNSSGKLTYTITNTTSGNSSVTSKTINLLSASISDWTNFNYDFSSFDNYQIEVTLSINNLNDSPLTLTKTYNFDITHDLALTTSYNTNGYAQWFTQEQLNTWVNSSMSNQSIYNFIDQYTIGYQLVAPPSDFTDWKVYFAPMPSDDSYGSNEFLTIQATCNTSVSVWLWSNSKNAFTSTGAITIPKDSVFTWTLPYELSQLYYSGGNVGVPLFNYQSWFSSSTGRQSIATPFGLSIGTEQDPTSISGDGQFSQAVNKVIEINYNNSSGSPYTAPESLYNQYTGTNNPINFNTSNNNTLSITSPELITFETTANLDGSVFNASTNSGTYTYSIVNETNGEEVSYSSGAINLSGNSSIFSYDFIEPGNYKITVTYDVKYGTNNENTISKTAIYYVNYNSSKEQTSASTLKLSSIDTLSFISNSIFSTSNEFISYKRYNIK